MGAPLWMHDQHVGESSTGSASWAQDRGLTTGHDSADHHGDQTLAGHVESSGSRVDVHLDAARDPDARRSRHNDHLDRVVPRADWGQIHFDLETEPTSQGRYAEHAMPDRGREVVKGSHEFALPATPGKPTSHEIRWRNVRRQRHMPRRFVRGERYKGTPDGPTKRRVRPAAPTRHSDHIARPCTEVPDMRGVGAYRA